MATQVQWRGGSTAEHATFTGAAREITVDTQKQTLVLHDGSTAGGRPLLREDGSNSALSLGSAAAPSLKFTGDNNTGIYSPGADQVAISTNGAGRLFINDSGQIFVAATATSGDSLNANGFRFGSGSIKQQSTVGFDFTQFYTSAGQAAPDASIFIPSSNAFGIKTSGSERLRITSAGLVGIGTASPLFPLDVNGVIYTRGRGSTFGVLFDDWRIYNSTAPGALVFDNGSERARIDSSGRLLVGTSTALTNIYEQATSYTPNVQFASASQSYNAGLSLINYSGLGYPATLTLGQSGSNTLNTNALVGSGNCVGSINFVVNDGTNFRSGATVQAFVDGASGSGDVPTRLVFSTTADGASSPTEHVRITSAGNTLFGTTSTSIGTTNFGTRFYGTEAPGRIATSRNVDGTGSVLQVYGNAGEFRVVGNGNVLNTNNSYGAISDIKLKENIVDANSQWSDIKALQVRKYNFKEGQTHTQIGLVAQEVELVSPGLVSESPDRDAEGNDLGTVTKSVNYSVLYMKAVKALQEAMERIETLEAKVAALESA